MHGFPVAETGFGLCEIDFAINAVRLLASLGHTDAQKDPAASSMRYPDTISLLVIQVLNGLLDYPKACFL